MLLILHVSRVSTVPAHHLFTFDAEVGRLLISHMSLQLSMKSSSLQFYLLTPEHTELSACGARWTPALQSKRQFCTGTGGGGGGYV